MFCKNCGKQLADSVSFCANCGTPTGISPQPAQAQQTEAPPVAEPVAPVTQAAVPQQPVAEQAAPVVIPVPPVTYQPQPPVQQGAATAQPPMMPPGGYPPPQSQQPQQYAPQYAPQQNYAQPYAPQMPMVKPRRKVSIPLISIIGVVVVGLLVAGGIMIFGPKGGGSTVNSSIVSKGVNTDDLGNIMNGQYYFDDGTYQYYASFDANTEAHIYKTSKGGTATPIFDGFGWSLVVNKGWLYFSGNQGKVIDNTYNLFRMKTDGTGLETLNTGYCYGMNIYKNYLYFISRPSADSYESYVYRSDLDGKNQTIVATGTIYYFIVYEKKLYYLDSSGIMYRANDDGTEPMPLSSDYIERFIIGNGKIVYTDNTGAVYHMNTDGTDVTEVAPAGAMPIASLNSYKDSIFYAEYDTNSVSGTYAYSYYLHKVNFDGSNNVQIYNSLSYGTYVNIVKDKVYVLDYAQDPVTMEMPAIAKEMDLNGQSVQELYR